jgi:hypothetical protein
MKEMNDFLLNMFTGADELRPAMTVPNLKNGVVYANDAHVLIAIPEDELSISYPTNEKYPDTESLLKNRIEKCTVKTVARMSDIAKELVRARIEVDKNFLFCEECKGDGVVEWEYESKSGREYTKDEECPVCNGERRKEISHPFARIRLSIIEDSTGNSYGIHIGELYFHPFHLYRLFMVALMHRVEVIEIFSDPDSYGSSIAYFGNIKVLIMLMMKP